MTPPALWFFSLPFPGCSLHVTLRILSDAVASVFASDPRVFLFNTFCLLLKTFSEGVK
jgi:hypothetical protein